MDVFTNLLKNDHSTMPVSRFSKESNLYWYLKLVLCCYKFYCVLARSQLKFDRRLGNSPGGWNWKTALVQGRWTSYLWGRILSN